MDQGAASAALLTDAQLAKRWGLSARTIKRWRAENKGKTPPCLPIGHRGGLGQGVRYRLDDVIAFEDARKVSGDSNGTDQKSS